MIEVQSLSFGYDKGLVLQDIHVKVEKNAFVAIIGPNGGGKSTFLKLLCGLLKPKAGKILIHGNHPNQLKGGIGYVPQIANFDKDFPISTLDVVLGGAIHHIPWHGHFTGKQKAKAKNALEQVDLLDYASTPFGDLSGGQAQRVLIARALMNTPEILVLDEPTASVDKEAKFKIYQLLKNLKGSVTIFFVTHEVPGLIPIADRVLCIKKTMVELDKQKVCGHFALGVYHENQ